VSIVLGQYGAEKVRLHLLKKNIMLSKLYYNIVLGQYGAEKFRLHLLKKHIMLSKLYYNSIGAVWSGKNSPPPL
jgi:hypothetical protein